MKKIVTIVGCLLFLTLFLMLGGWFKKTHRPSPLLPAPTTAKQCILVGRPCWEIIRLTFNETESIEPSEEIKRATPDWQEKIEYKNSSLQELGVSVVSHEQYRDGGSESYTLSNGVYLHMNGEIDSPNRWQTTLVFPDNKKIVFDEQGYILSPARAQ